MFTATLASSPTLASLAPRLELHPSFVCCIAFLLEAPSTKLSISPSSAISSMEPPAVHRVISIPLLLDLICQHLGPRNIVLLIQVSKAFHSTFLPYRWRILDNGDVGLQSDSDCSRAPIAEVQGALVRYGASLTRQLVIKACSSVLLHLLLREQACCNGLLTIEHGCLSSGYLRRFRLAWKNYDDVQDHPMITHGRMYLRQSKLQRDKELRLPSLNTKAGKEKEELTFVSFDSRFMTLMLAERNRRHLRKLGLTNDINDENRDHLQNLGMSHDSVHFLSVPFSIRCVQVVSKLESLRSLRLGHVSEVTFMDIWQHLPSQVEELLWTTHRTTVASLYTSNKDLEDDWTRYQRSVRAILASNDGDDASGGGNNENASYPAFERISREGDQIQTIHSMMVSTTPKRRLHTLVLEGHFASRPLWLLNEILNHCPNLRSFTFPSIKLGQDGVDLLLETLNGLDNLSELNMRWLILESDEQYARIFELFTAAEGNQLSRHTYSTMMDNWSHQQRQPFSSSASATRMLRSLTLPRSSAFTKRSFAALALHHSTLEELRYCSVMQIEQKTVLNLLASCPRLRHFAILQDRTSSNGNSVDWEYFIQPEETTLIQSEIPPTAEAEARYISLHKQLTMFALPEKMQARLIWPCTETLTTLSLTLRLGCFYLNEGDLSSPLLQINQQLSRFKALEDLSLRCEAGTSYAISAIRHPLDLNRDRTYMGHFYMDWTLEHGLGYLGSLKRMRCLHLFHARHRVGRPELEWMLENWPNLESLPGLFNARPSMLDENSKKWILDHVQCP